MEKTRLESSRDGQIAAVIEQLLSLKRTPRRGWLQRNVTTAACESVADHTFGVALLTWLLAEELGLEIDLLRALKMALVHDLAEAITGDITPDDHVPAEEKTRRERDALGQLLTGVGQASQWQALHEEYNRAETPEAQFVKAIDKLEMIAQAGSYRDALGPAVAEFAATARPRLEASPLAGLMRQLLDETSTRSLDDSD